MKQSAGEALISAASGIGDIIRVTPLIRVAHLLGYEVDVLLAPDDPEAVQLIRGAPEVRQVFLYSPRAKHEASWFGDSVRKRCYDVATFTTLSASLGRWVNANRRYSFDNNWRIAGDAASVSRLARSLGWFAPLPAPFAMKSPRRFCLLGETIAFHAGCKPTWPWKRWHGFPELARFYPSVAIVGTAADLENFGTYFAQSFEWPQHAQDFVGKLNLLDTAALLSQCSALVSIDSGMMHLSVAVGTPTFGIFGITNPNRECIPSPLMTPITKGLPCEAACRRQPWGRRDCEHHLACLKTLTAREVAAQVQAVR